MRIRNILLQCMLFLASLLASCNISTMKIQEFKDAYSNFDGNNLVVGTKNFKRSWKLQEYGLVTTGIYDIKASKEWVNSDNGYCDWSYNGLLDESSKAELLSYSAKEDNDNGFATPHLCVELEFYYPQVETYLKYQIRAYPEANGLYTSISLKGNSEKYVRESKKNSGVQFNLVSGKEKYDYAANGLVKDYIASYAFDNKKVEYLIGGLDKTKEYTVGLTWWSYTDKKLVQNLNVTSVDGELRHSIFTNRTVPTGAKKQQPETLTFDLPSDVLLDGSFRLIVDKVKGKQAIISEIWIQEKAQEKYMVDGDVDRVTELKKQVEPGSVLMAYMNCGVKNRQNTDKVTGRVDFLPIDATRLVRRYAGYYNDTQHRNTRETPLLKEEVVNTAVEEKEINSWANVLFVEDESNTLILVKESHKCVNQYGYDTGAFELTTSGISNTGTSLLPQEILKDRYRQAWASWIIVGDNSEDGRELAIKSFERLRYPVNPETDIYIIANTWGSDRGIEASNENNVLKEMSVQKYLGIDVQQIDDGYQKPAKDNKNGKINGWYPHPDRYPEGFKNVRAKAEEYGLKLGLWFAAMPVSLQEMKDNYDAAGFSYYKLDFANIRNHNHIEQMIDKIRAYELYTNYKSKVNWDVTENAPRFGYFWAKEYGCVFLENRKPKFPENVVYVPYLVLRDLWHLSKYCNLNKFQGSVQNKDMVDKTRSDAYKYSHAYTAAIPLMSTPLFFQETQFYSKQALEEIKPVILAYKQERDKIYNCLVYPVGNEPDNASWTGFQAHDAFSNSGYLNIFREIENKESVFKIKMRFIAGMNIRFTDIMNGESFDVNVDDGGMAEFTIDNPGGFRMYKYVQK